MQNPMTHESVLALACFSAALVIITKTYDWLLSMKPVEALFDILKNINIILFGKFVNKTVQKDFNKNILIAFYKS